MGRCSRGRSALQVLTEPMFVLLLAAAGISFVFGDLREALFLSTPILVIIGIAIVQERPSDSVLAKPREPSSPRTFVVRDGIERRVAGSEVVALAASLALLILFGSLSTVRSRRPAA